jgi:hypothetical protein
MPDWAHTLNIYSLRVFLVVNWGVFAGLALRRCQQTMRKTSAESQLFLSALALM